MEELFQAIEERRSARVFLPTPVAKETIRQMLRLAINAPSANNLQPWEFVVVAGEEKDRLSRTLLKAYREKQISCGSGAVKPLPDVFRRRGIANEEAMRRYIEATGQTVGKFVNEGSCNFYGAPAAAILCLDDCFSSRQMIDTGIALAYLALAAHGSGLATCPIGLLPAYEDEVKDLLNIPENKQVVIGLALGYPDLESPMSLFRSAREDISKFVRWIE